MHLVAAPVIIILLLVAIGVYMVRVVAMPLRRRWLTALVAAMSIASVAAIAAAFAIGLTKSSSAEFYKASIAFTVSYILTAPLLIYMITDLLSRIPMLWRRKPWMILRLIGGTVAVAIFLMLIAGVFTRKGVKVKEVEMEFSRLPEGFDGVTIAQISDMHLESFGTDTTFVAKVVEKINSLNPDVVVFTGDMVSRRSDEMNPFVATLSRVEAPMGVYAVLGNHDYADYVDMSDEERVADREELRRLYGETAFKLMRDTTELLISGNDTIALIGTENIGKPPYAVYGNLQKAYKTLDDNRFKVLLTHDPDFWVDSISTDKSRRIDLTLSGHTHAMQFSILGVTPASLVYDTPAGEYDDTTGRKLYVNPGLGTVGPMLRVGATPEITLIKLRRK